MSKASEIVGQVDESAKRKKELQLSLEHRMPSRKMAAVRRDSTGKMELSYGSSTIAIEDVDALAAWAHEMLDEAKGGLTCHEE